MLASTIGPVFGFVLSSGMFLRTNYLMEEADFMAWGWRISFLASLLLLVVGIYVRSRVPESPMFEARNANRSAGETRKLPISALFKKHPKMLLLASGANTCHFATFYTFTV